MTGNFFVKNILRAFDDNTLVKYYFGDELIKEWTVKEYMDCGLTTYDSINNGDLKIENNTIIVRIAKEA